MLRNDLLDKYNFDTLKLLNYGFKLDNDSYCLQKELNINNMFTIIKYNSKSLIIKVYDEDSYEYFPFEQIDSFGSYVSEIRNRVDLILKDIVDKCCVINNIKSEILKFCQTELHTIVDNPWNEYPDYYTLKTIHKNKWYGLIMTIPYKSLNINKEGLVDVINLKNTPSKIEKIINNQIYFKAYHMNKTHWFTALLINDTNLIELKQLIKESYSLIEPLE